MSLNDEFRVGPDSALDQSQQVFKRSTGHSLQYLHSMSVFEGAFRYIHVYRYPIFANSSFNLARQRPRVGPMLAMGILISVLSTAYDISSE